MVEFRHSLLMKFIKEKQMYTMAKRNPEAIMSRIITLVKLTGTIRYAKIITLRKGFLFQQTTPKECCTSSRHVNVL